MSSEIEQEGESGLVGTRPVGDEMDGTSWRGWGATADDGWAVNVSLWLLDTRCLARVGGGSGPIASTSASRRCPRLAHRLVPSPASSMPAGWHRSDCWTSIGVTEPILSPKARRLRDAPPHSCFQAPFSQLPTLTSRSSLFPLLLAHFSLFACELDERRAPTEETKATESGERGLKL